MSGKVKEDLRVLLITAKVYQMCADIFAVFGIALFAYIYFKHFSQNPFQALRDPFIIVTILFPFIPAAVMAYIASKKRRKIRLLLEEGKK
ncbi:MAG: hypothetical protein DI551_05845 [Micavibrio aeruginosavorus]|uniref:Uncharacterized protein n=1 Tax=Micavibrio aeruginosavorus TaxID=349221 RepID=A0A2W5N099_9BACT|nr:MAG: hypothetical protein DI551_05845 [Micavibrio aeruginosavorus]